jgi:hypothetical protein
MERGLHRHVELAHGIKSSPKIKPRNIETTPKIEANGHGFAYQKDQIPFPKPAFQMSKKSSLTVIEDELVIWKVPENARKILEEIPEKYLKIFGLPAHRMDWSTVTMPASELPWFQQMIFNYKINQISHSPL